MYAYGRLTHLCTPTFFRHLRLLYEQGDRVNKHLTKWSLVELPVYLRAIKRETKLRGQFAPL